MRERYTDKAEIKIWEEEVSRFFFIEYLGVAAVLRKK